MDDTSDDLPPLPPIVAGVAAPHIARHARTILDAADRRVAQRHEDNAWDREAEGFGLLQADEQLILIAATRLTADHIPDDHQRRRLEHRARQALVASGRRFVMREAHRLAGATTITSRRQRFLELVALGEDALMARIDHHDLAHGSTFMAHAAPWIHQRMQRFIYRNSSPVYVPEYIQADAQRMIRIRNDLHDMGIHVTPEILAAEMTARTGETVTVGHIERYELALASRSLQTLDGMAKSNDGAERIEGGAWVEREEHHLAVDTDPGARLQATQLAADVRRAIDALDSAEQREMIRDRHGIDRPTLGPEAAQAKHSLTKGQMDGLKERGERNLALPLAPDHRPAYLAEAMAEMDADAAEVLRLAHGVDFAGVRRFAPRTDAEIAHVLEWDERRVRTVRTAAEKQVALLMTRVIPNRSPRRHEVDDAGQITL